MTNALRLVETNRLTGAPLLDAVTTFVSRFIVFPHEHCAPMLTLWYAHTHAAEHFYVTPRLVISSAEPGSGKTLVIEVGQYLVAKPEMVLNASTPAVFRMVANNGPITLLWDEVDATFTSGGGANEDLRAMLNAGYKRTAYVARCVGDSHSVQRPPSTPRSSWSGSPEGCYPPSPPAPSPSTCDVRSGTRRRRSSGSASSNARRNRCGRHWPHGSAASAKHLARRSRPCHPEWPTAPGRSGSLCWPSPMPLVALAEHRPPSLRALRARSRPAARHHRRAAPGRPAHHLRRPGNRPAGHVDILTDLVALDEAPWGDINGGRPLDPRRLARELAQYHVTPVPFRTGGQITKGYVAYPTSGQLGFADAWSRYLPTDNNDGEEDSWNH